MDRDGPTAPHQCCRCIACEHWRSRRVHVGDLVRPAQVVRSRWPGEFDTCESQATTWDIGRLIWKDSLPLDSVWLVVSDERHENVDAHLSPITVVAPGRCKEPRRTSKGWVEVVSSGRDAEG